MAREKTHRYAVRMVWSGAAQGPTRDYRSYSREHRYEIEGKAPLPGSADLAFRGDPTLHTPEDLLVAAVSSCHMLWYLHLCTEAGVEVRAYEDNAEGKMVESAGAGRFTAVALRPVVTISPESDPDRALALHAQANSECFIANSLNFPVTHEPVILRAEE